MKKLLLVFLSLFFLWGCQSQQSRYSADKVVGQGEVIRVEYLNAGFLTSHRTIIYFADNSILTLIGIYSIPGKNIIVYHTGGDELYEIQILNEVR